ncbi:MULTISPECIES: spore germination protein [unclassified Bacillus (in: firmicutes)]|uniref:spore germination protein n=1 Tax=unclassified Bacillus (in: firmicutes) TaxID=185979 RepID=UPI0015965DE7|nr:MULTISPECIES: spore germination protein [unclassified Bacillus (in: firmicutes)]
MQIEETSLTKNIYANIKLIKEQLHDSPELLVRLINLDPYQNYCALLFIDGLANTQVIRESIIEPLLEIRKIDKESLMDTIAIRYIRSESVEEVTSISSIIDGIVRGKTLVLVDGFDSVLLVDTTEWQKRAVEQSTKQRNFQGTLISFTEELKVNLNILHNMIPSPILKVEKKQIGRIVKTEIAIVYLTDFVDETVLEEVRQRIDSLEVNYVMESRIIEEAIEGDQKTIFPLSFNSEIPDAVSAALYEGRIAVFTNGTPTASIVPNLFIQYFQEPNEYNTKEKYAKRILTFLCFFITILSPGSYLTLIYHHKNWVPPKIQDEFFQHMLLPYWLEIFITLIFFQILGFSSYRISKEMILLASLVSTITLGSIAVEAKVIHPLSLIVVGICYLTSTILTIGKLPDSIITLRYVFLFLGLLFGITGLCIGVIILIIHLSRLRSVGVPYLAPIIPFNYKEFKDVFYRGDLRKLTNSPHKYPHDDKQ